MAAFVHNINNETLTSGQNSEKYAAGCSRREDCTVL